MHPFVRLSAPDREAVAKVLAMLEEQEALSSASSGTFDHDHAAGFEYAQQRVYSIGVLVEGRDPSRTGDQRLGVGITIAYVPSRPWLAISWTEASVPPNDEIRYFLSYSRKDQGDVDRFLAVIQPRLQLLKSRRLTLWIDRQIDPGEPWRAAIDQALEECHFGLLLVSANFLTTEFIVKNELPALLAKRMVVPVALHRLSFDGKMDLKGLEEHQIFHDQQRRPFDACEDDKTRRDFAHDLAASIEHRLSQATPPPATGRDAYLARVIDEQRQYALKYSDLAGTHQPVSETTLLVEDLFRNDLANIEYEPCEPHPGTRAPARSYPKILDAFLQVKRAALLGDPGAGKSTTLRRLAFELATQAQQDFTAPLPLFAMLGDWKDDRALLDFLARQAPELGGTIDGLLQKGQLVLLLDGLNEMPTRWRDTKAQAVRHLPQQASLYVSCRQEDYRDGLDLRLGVLTLAPLSPERIRAAAENWVRVAGQDQALAHRFFWQLAANGDPASGTALQALLRKWESLGATEHQFWAAARPAELDAVYAKTTGPEYDLWQRHAGDPRSLLRLAANPFMLVMLFTVWGRNNASLPRNRGDLLHRFASNLLEKLAKGPSLEPEAQARLRAALAALAWQMQRDARSAQDLDLGVLTVVPRAAALNALGAAGLQHALGATILEGDSELRFRHQLLQEYFSAQALNQRLATTPATELWPPERWWQRNGWEVTAVLLAGLHPQDGAPIVRWLAVAQPEVAAQCVVESGAVFPHKAALLEELRQLWEPRLLAEPQPEARAAIGRALGRLHLDQRQGVGVKGGIPDIDWVQIPAGEFLYQEEKRKRKSQAFAMARYPVTNGQYQAFIEAEDGYRLDRWWQGLTEPDRRPVEPAWAEANHPRERVSWQEAMAFCAWLSEKLSLTITLPTEHQWERAARFTDGREYPWGNGYVAGHANIDETEDNVGPHYLGRTSPVGIYPLGASQEGVLDLSGNVWECCLNRYTPEEVWRFLRGGSWDYNRESARAGYRSGGLAVGRNNNVGFRLVCSSPIR